MLRLEDGVEFTVHGHEERHVSHSHLDHNVSDLPATRKVAGLHGHTSKFFMCPLCKQPYFSLAHPDCFDPERFKLQDNWRLIKYSFQARNAHRAVIQRISENHGWLPAQSSLIEFMHTIFLSIVSHVCQTIILKCGMLNGGQAVKPMERIQDFFESLVWPVEATQLPPSFIIGKGSPKADQWQNILTVLFVALFVAWEYAEVDRAHNAKMDCNFHRHYRVILEFSAAICILSLCSLSCTMLSHACKSWACMDCHLTPYFHLVNHLESQLYHFGPCYATWAFPYQHHNR
ncbi:hypothetical protein L210DRAFT_3614134 [Boletus edulis BED1]|uniref:Uncharacterized protein n=1 Tax=Boletus edulis BED1 TaxID=1328754 RepID=A0AAD4BL66_BOLED|nr:hypothetical protein L210DRAFT_3614134 [Boletus edulis BED1]